MELLHKLNKQCMTKDLF